ncbi:alpha/beta hydrolase [Catalinimonas alkaloidigena]|nr:alpha/beta hydrolase [Catalinimonas alkaloidigena]
MLAGIVLLTLIGVVALVVYRWTQTPYGPLDYKATIGLRLVYTPPDITQPVAQLRARFAEEDLKLSDAYRARIAAVVDTFLSAEAGKLPLRLYFPATEPEASALPVVLYFHGGGFVFGSLDEYNGVCARLAQKTGAIIVSVDYRLAPEHPFPAAANDAYAALRWVAQHAAALGGDSTRLAVMGDSAGGNLAAVVAQMARDRHGPSIAYQVLFYPATQSLDFATPSHQRYGRDYGITTERIQWYTRQYLPDTADRSRPYASPLLAKEFENLPPALVVLAGFDPLRSEGEAYAKKLQAAGVPTQLVVYETMIHGFLSIEAFDQSDEAISMTASVLRPILFPHG